MARKLTIELMQRIAAEKAGKCLSKKYKHVKSNLLWECSKGHRWYATPDSVKNARHWCHECGGSKKSTIEQMNKLAKMRGGKCLSTNYVNDRTKLIWICANGHEWETTPSKIKQGSWCPSCAHNAPVGIEDAFKIAQKRNGECLSKVYSNARKPLLWQCSEKHQWKASLDSVKNKGTWCIICNGNAKNTLNEMQGIAKARGGECLSNEYVSNRKNLHWECKKGHRWYAAPDSIKNRGSWCPFCYGNIKLSIEDAHEIARKNGGKCLSHKYENMQSLLKWQCKEGHIWKANLNSVKIQKTWCGRCNKFISEEKCRAVFEQLTGLKFPKLRPDWLRNPKTGYTLELDGYCEEIAIAFEYQGKQHYE